MSKTTTTSILTVRELTPNPTLTNYSFVEALSDAGYSVYYDSDPEARGRPAGEKNIVYLWDSGCRTPDGWDCERSCRNATAVWTSADSMFTLQNCLIRPFLEYSAAKGWLHEDSAGLLDRYGIGLSTSNSVEPAIPQRGDWPAIGDCRKAMCQQLRPDRKDCEVNPGNKNYDTRHEVGLHDKIRLFVDVNFCRVGWMTPNSDIGGAGVLASYIQQLAIAILGWAFMRAPEIKLAIFGRLVPRTRARLEEKLTAFKDRASTAATVSALVSFQETQIFFSLTLQVACLITFRKATLLMSPSVIELVVNRFLVKLIGAVGVFPVVLNLCTIRRHQATVDWFILIASSCCVLIAIATWSFAKTLTFKPDQLQESGRGPPQCGNKNPLQHCFGDLTTNTIRGTWLGRYSLTAYDKFFLSEPALIVPLLTLMGLAATKFKRFRVRPYVSGDIFEWTVAQLPQDTQRNHLKSIFHVLVAILECWLVITSIALLIATSTLMIPVSDRGNAWILGQIIAVAVWAPVLVNWLHLLYRGPKAGLDFQMANGYVVVKQPMDTMASMALLHARAASPSEPQGDSNEGHPLGQQTADRSGRSSTSVPASLQHEPEQTTAPDWARSQSSLTPILLHKSGTAPPA